MMSSPVPRVCSCTRTRSRVGKSYFTFRLVRSQRVGDKVRQRTLLNLGPFPHPAGPLAHPLPIQRILDPRAELLPIECDRQGPAHRRTPPAGRWLADPAPDPIPAPPPDPAPQDSRQPDFQRRRRSLKLARPRSVGVEHAALWAAEQLGLPDLQSRARPARRPHRRPRFRTRHLQRSALGLLGGDFETMGLSRQRPPAAAS